MPQVESNKLDFYDSFFIGLFLAPSSLNFNLKTTSDCHYTQNPGLKHCLAKLPFCRLAIGPYRATFTVNVLHYYVNFFAVIYYNLYHLTLRAPSMRLVGPKK